MGSTSALTETFKALKDGKRTTGEQGWIQLGALGITLVISVLSGSLCGYLASHVGKSGEGVNDRFNLFTDDGHWEADDGIDYNIDRQQEVVTTAVQAENKVAGEVNAYAAGTPSRTPACPARFMLSVDVLQHPPRPLCRPCQCSI